MMNRTCSDVGSCRLADMLGKPLTEAKAIRERQQLLQRMREDESFLTRFRVEMLSAAKEDYRMNGNKGEEALLSLSNADWENGLIYPRPSLASGCTACLPLWLRASTC